MFIALCVGNTSINMGFFEKGRPGPLLETIPAHLPDGNPDKYAVIYAGEIRKKLRKHASAFKNKTPEGAVFCSVVPALTPVIKRALEQIAGKKKPTIKTLEINYKMIERAGMALRVERPSQTGIDRLLAAYGGWRLFGGPLAVVDAGTALTVNFVSADGGFLGGAILPGAGLMARALHDGTAKLPEIKVKTGQKAAGKIPPSPIGKNTSSAIISGIIYAMAGAVEKLLVEGEKTKGFRAPLRTVLTGGDSALLYSLLKRSGEKKPRVYSIEPALVLKAMRSFIGEQRFSKADA